ncbi:MAG: tetraacyldisaccharide 4'-kinase [Flavobacteriaceae bacterium]
MGIFRFLLFPFAIIYMLLTSIRNVFFSWGIFKEVKYDVPVLGIGNLSTGGTGKSVAINYFIEHFKARYAVHVLSRGYGRSSKGFQLGTQDSDANQIGDEPLMFLKQHPGITVGVSNDRRKGMQNLLDLEGSKRPSLYLWDDCYQHRWVKPSFLLLLTTYDKPYTRDFILPVGNLRELSEGAFRANAIVVTKCPKDLSVEDKDAFRERIQLKEKQRLFFSHIKYADFIVNKERKMSLSILDKISFLLITGIADPTSLLDFLNGKFLNFDHIKFSDHHVFSDRDIEKIISKSNGRMVLTTQKDYMRLSTKFNSDLLFFMPIEMVIQDEREQEFLSFVEKGLGLH